MFKNKKSIQFTMKILSFILYSLLSLRYRIQIRGEEVLKNRRAKIILPNHQAEVDPQIIGAIVSRHSLMVPVVAEQYYKLPFLKQLFKLIGAVPVSDLSTGSRDVSVLKTIFSSVTSALEKGKTVLLYPAGQLAGQGYEKIFNKQSAWSITSNLPDGAQVIGVRITGLWGSMWSRAWIGKSPNFLKTLMKALFYVIANLIFFIPKRNVTIEFFDITEQALEKASRGKTEFNNFLENLYNEKGEEDCLFLKHYFFVPKLEKKLPEVILGSVAHMQSINSFKDEDVPSNIFQRVSEIISKQSEVEISKITLSSNLSLDLNIDSLGLVDIVFEIEKTFKRSSQVEVGNIKTVADLCFIAMNRKLDDEELKPSLINTFLEEHSDITIDADGTIPHLFVKSFRRLGSETFAYDKMIGTSTRKDFLLKAYVVAEIIKKENPGKYVGIMLPALQSTTLLVAATYLSGKIPVMLNWTVGPKVLDHCVESIGLSHILTAKTFFDKVADSLTDKQKAKCIFFEQKVKQLTLSTKLKGLLNCKMGSIPSVSPTDTAVILFTSGSESLPKAVELSHRNILADLSGAFRLIKLQTDKIFLSFLPPFHSFGFSILTIFPLVSAVKIAYTPDPTDSREVLKILLHTGANMLLGTPTFLKMILSVSSGFDLKHVQMVISGAENMPQAIAEEFRRKTGGKAMILEGYGITECSPILTINPQALQKEKSVGQFIPGVEHLIASIETNTPLPQGKEGMILVTGANIFKGYSDPSIASPFVQVNGKSYYKTGDLGYVDEDGYLFITGRLKRFIKIAGEMISLPAIESALLKKFGQAETVALAVEGSDKIEPPQIGLFAIADISIAEANACLKEAGFSSLVKIHRFIKVDAIPLLGTGKVDYKVLKAQIK